jgi:hypothetical protein
MEIVPETPASASGASGSPFSAFARRSANLTGAPANSVSKNASSAVICGDTGLSTRVTVEKSEAGAAPRPRAPGAAAPRAAPRPCSCWRACATACCASSSACCAFVSASSAAVGGAAAATKVIAAFAPSVLNAVAVPVPPRPAAAGCVAVVPMAAAVPGAVAGTATGRGRRGCACWTAAATCTNRTRQPNHQLSLDVAALIVRGRSVPDEFNAGERDRSACRRRSPETSRGRRA